MAAFAYNFLPGVQVTTIDGGLVARRVPTSKGVLVMGTSAIGPANEPFAVTDRAVAAQVFGFDGSLVRGLEEVAVGGADNITLFRIGTQAATLSNVGYQATSLPTPGFKIAFGSVTSTVGTDYKIWYDGAGILWVWFGTQLVFSNDPSDPVDTGDLTITGAFGEQGAAVTGNAGLALGTGSPTLANAITVLAAAALLNAEYPAVIPNTFSYWTGVAQTSNFLPAVLGTGLTARQLYIALANAYQLLDIFPIDEVVVPDAIFDNPTVAFYVSGNAATAANNPATNPNSLDWLHVATDSLGNSVYHWASETHDTSGASVGSATWGTSALRLAAGYGEVNFGHQAATFAQKQELVGQAGTCLVFIGTSQPASFKLVDLRTWVGFLPQYDPTVIDQVGSADIKVTIDGAGLLGNPFLAGCTSARLNPLAADHAGGRTAGMFQTDNGFYDGVPNVDKNGNLVDIGAYQHIVADVGILANGFKNGYGTNLANYAGGYTATLDEKVNLTNKPVKASQLWKPNSVQLDSATKIGINFLRFKGTGNLPVFTHGQTAATNASDYKNLLRQRIKGLVIDTLRTTADPFIGASSIDGLQVQSMQTALTNKLMTLQKRGYMSRFSFTVTTTPAQQRIGHANIDITFNPADELIQLDASVALSRS